MSFLLFGGGNYYSGVNILQKSVNSSGTVVSQTKNSTVTKLSNVNISMLFQRYLAKDSLLIPYLVRNGCLITGIPLKMLGIHT